MLTLNIVLLGSLVMMSTSDNIFSISIKWIVKIQQAKRTTAKSSTRISEWKWHLHLHANWIWQNTLLYYATNVFFDEL